MSDPHLAHTENMSQAQGWRWRIPAGFSFAASQAVARFSGRVMISAEEGPQRELARVAKGENGLRRWAQTEKVGFTKDGMMVRTHLKRDRA